MASNPRNRIGQSDFARIQSCLKVPLGTGELKAGDQARLTPEPKPYVKKTWNGWNVQSTPEGSSDHVIIGPGATTVLQIRANKDTQVNNIHVRFFNPPEGFRAEIGIVGQEWPVGLRKLHQMTVSGPDDLIEARRGFPTSRAIVPLVTERRDRFDRPMLTKSGLRQSKTASMLFRLWKLVKSRFVRSERFCLGMERKIIDLQSYKPPIVEYPHDYWLWRGVLRDFYGHDSVAVVVIANLPCPCLATMSGR